MYLAERNLRAEKLKISVGPPESPYSVKSSVMLSFVGSAFSLSLSRYSPLKRSVCIRNSSNCATQPDRPSLPPIDSRNNLYAEFKEGLDDTPVRAVFKFA